MSSTSRERTCPRDGVELVAGSHLEIDFLGCRRCGGLWFPRDGLERIELRAPKGSRPPRAAPPGGARPAAGPVECVCAGRPAMEPVERSGVTVDLCPACGAVWLDAGEIERILQCYREPEAGHEGQPDAATPLPLTAAAGAVGQAAWSVTLVGKVLDFLIGSAGPVDV